MDSRIDSGGVAGMGSALDPSLALIEVQSQNGQPSQTSAVMDGVTGVVDTIMAGTAEAQEKLESAVSEVAIAVKPIERASHKRFVDSFIHSLIRTPYTYLHITTCIHLWIQKTNFLNI